MATEPQRRSSAGDGHELHGNELQDEWPVMATELQKRSSAGVGHELQGRVRPVMAQNFKEKFGR
jgi:hypothetical protein